MSNPCTDVLSDSEYLEHMIPHHQVAIDMSEMLIPNSKHPDVLHLCRNFIRNQIAPLLKERFPSFSSGFELTIENVNSERVLLDQFIQEKLEYLHF